VGPHARQGPRDLHRVEGNDSDLGPSRLHKPARTRRAVVRTQDRPLAGGIRQTGETKPRRSHARFEYVVAGAVLPARGEKAGPLANCRAVPVSREREATSSRR